MSDLTQDARAFGGIVSNLFDGKATLSQTGTALAALGSTVGAQIKTEEGKIAKSLGPQATAQVNAVIAPIQHAAGNAVALLDADVAPYMAAAAKAVEVAVDTVMDAAIPGGAALNPLVNGGIDALAATLRAAVDAQALAWKAKLAATVLVAPAAT